MAKFSLRRYETQARMSLIVGILSSVCLLMLGYLVFRNADLTEWVIYYGQRWRGRAVQAMGALTVLSGIFALGFGLNSAGQRRNTRPRESWLGFFLGAGVICFAIVLVFVFRQRGLYIGR